MSGCPIKTRGDWEYCASEQTNWKRRIGTLEWEILDSPPAGIPPMELKLVRQRQMTDEIYHWSTFPACEGKRGAVFQVKGDVVAMRHKHTKNINILECQSYVDSYIIARPTEDQAARVHYWAANEPAPCAIDQAAVHENCQGWIIRVMRRLVTENIVLERWVNNAMSLQQPVR